MEARLYKKLPDRKVSCYLCNHHCKILPGKRGVCMVRENQNGKLVSLVYKKLAAANIDPIEKKPLFHFLPGSRSYSISTVGCNFRCEFCFAPETTVITGDGPMQINELFQKGGAAQEYVGGHLRQVEGHGAITHLGSINTISTVFEREYNGDIIEIKPFYLPPVRCTPNHEFFATANPISEGVQKVKAAHLTNKHYVLIPKIAEDVGKEWLIDTFEILKEFETNCRTHRKTDRSDLKEITRMRNDGATSREIGERFEMHPAYIRNLLSKLRKNGIPNKPFLYKNEVLDVDNGVRFKTEKQPAIPRYVQVDEDFAELLGYYCGEGRVTRLKQRPNSCKLVISFGKHEKDKVARAAELIENIFGIKAKILDRRTTTTAEVGKTSLAQLFRYLCGGGARDKGVPDIISCSKNNVILSFLRAYVASDGYLSERVVSINTVSKKLAMGVYWLFLRLGILPNYHLWVPPKTKIIEGREVRQSPLHYVKLTSEVSIKKFFGIKKKARNRKGPRFIEDADYYYAPIMNISKQPYSGPVYNFEVSGPHSYLANFASVSNCQNWDISQASKNGNIFGRDVEPEEIVEAAVKTGCESISYTYTEPTIFYEYAEDCAKLAVKQKLKNVFVSNGFMTEECLKASKPWLHALNIDLKSFSDQFYRKVCGARLEPVLDSLKKAKKMGYWVEVTTLIVPTQNDSKDELRQAAQFIAKEMGKDVPWHLSAFHPDYKMTDLPVTPTDTLLMARQLARDEGMKYVYIGNTYVPDGEDTICPKCGGVLIRRTIFNVEGNSLKKGQCPSCKTKIDGVW